MKHADLYKTANELNITQAEFSGLKAVSRKLSTGAIPEEAFCLSNWCSCIRHHLEEELGYRSARSAALERLYYGHWQHIKRDDGSDYNSKYDNHDPSNRERAAIAIENFLMGMTSY